MKYKDMNLEQRKAYSAKVNAKTKEARVKARLVDGLPPLPPTIKIIRLDIHNAPQDLIDAISKIVNGGN